MSEIDQNLVRFLKDPNKIKRKNSLKKLKKQIDPIIENIKCKEKDGSYKDDKSDVRNFLNTDSVESILHCFNDPSEINRELATNIIYDYLNFLSAESESSICLSEKSIKVELFNKCLPLLEQTLGTEDLYEPCEEIRLAQMRLLNLLILKTEPEENERILTCWLTELISILSKTSIDNFHEIRKLAHNNIKNLIEKIPKTFHLMAESLLNPVLKSFSHQHSKIRVSAIETLCCIIMKGGKTCLPDKLVIHFSQRLFDSHFNVRLSVIKVAAKLMIEYDDRYSFHSQLMPLILTGLHDEADEIQQEAAILWERVGQVYESENEDKLREAKNYKQNRVDAAFFSNSVAIKTINKGERFCLGCREICSKEISKLLPGIRNDLQDWQSSSRVAASRLLTSLLLLCEENITQHFQLAYTAILLSINNCEDDNEGKETFKQLNIASQLLGIFVTNSDLFLSHTKVHLDKTSSLIILSNILEARPILYSQNENQQEELESKVDEFLMSDVISRRTQVESNAQFSLIKLGSFTKNFDVILSVAATTKFPKVQEFAEAKLDDSETKGFNGFNTAMEKCDEIIATLDDDTWIRNSVDLNVLIQLFSWIRRSEWPVLTEKAFNFLTNQLNSESEPENRIEILMALARLFSLVKKCQVKDEQVMENLFKPSLKWRAGKSQLAARSASCAALWSYIHLVTDFTYFEVNLMPEIISLLDDDLEQTREIACRLVDKIIENAGDFLSLDNFYHKIYIELVKRLDDVSDSVRCLSLTIWQRLFNVFLKKTKSTSLAVAAASDGDDKIVMTYDASGCYSAHWEYIYKSLILHMDDPDENFRKQVFETLKLGREISSKILLEELEKAKGKHKFAGLCEDLEELLIC